MNGRRALGAVLALGLLASTAFDPLQLPGAMLLAVGGLFLLLRHLPESTRLRLAIGLGFVFGLAFMTPLIWWMRAVGPGAHVGLVLAESVLMAAIVPALWAVARRPGWPLWMAAVWTAGEFVRGSFPFSGFPWGRLAHTSIDTPLASIVRVLGTGGLSFVMALLACALVVAAEQREWRHRVIPLVAVAATFAVGSVLPTGLAGNAGERTVAVVQGGVPGEFLQWPPGAIFALHAKATQRLINQIDAGEARRPDIVLWPENSTDSDPINDPAVKRRIESLSADLRAPILVGGIFDGPTVDTAYNAGVLWTAAGPGQRYIKRKPVPYGEYVPFRDSIGRFLPVFERDIPRDMLAGQDVGLIDADGALLGDTICYDIAYDGVVRDAIDAGAQVLVVQTSNAAFSNTSQPEQQWDISRLRAIESGRWVLVPSTNGISGVVNADGEVVKRAPYDTPTVLTVDVPLASTRTLASRWGSSIDLAIVVVALGGLAAAVIARRRPVDEAA